MLVSATEQVVRIQDDETVPQPFYGSMIYHPGDDVVYSNGNAFAIRLLGDVYIGVEEHDRSFAGLNVYPNPSNGQLTVDLTSEHSEVVRMQLLSATGVEVLSEAISVVPGQNRQQIALDGVANGLYLLRVSGSEHESVLRVAVQH
jgi:hypothetical protein